MSRGKIIVEGRAAGALSSSEDRRDWSRRLATRRYRGPPPRRPTAISRNVFAAEFGRPYASCAWVHFCVCAGVDNCDILLLGRSRYPRFVISFFIIHSQRVRSSWHLVARVWVVCVCVREATSETTVIYFN